MHILTLDTGLGITMRITLILVIYTLLCVQGICSTSSKFLQVSTLLPPEGRHLMHFMCSQRKGVLCGFCSDGLSVYFHSRDYHCGSESLCSYGLLFYALSELLPVVVIFTIIIFFNISFTSGNVNGLILFSQALDIVTINFKDYQICLLYTSPSPRDATLSRMPSSA